MMPVERMYYLLKKHQILRVRRKVVMSVSPDPLHQSSQNSTLI